MHYQGGLVRLNEFFAISFLRKLPRPCEEVKIVGRSLILDPLKGAIVFACLFAVDPSVSAQNDPSAPGSDSLSRIIVQGIASEHSVLPTATDLPDVLGFDLPVNEVPRSISVITKEELENANVRTARDLARISADTYTPYFNGNPSSIYIRGHDLLRLFESSTIWRPPLLCGSRAQLCSGRSAGTSRELGSASHEPVAKNPRLTSR